jgi:hypothetical protein
MYKVNVVKELRLWCLLSLFILGFTLLLLVFFSAVGEGGNSQSIRIRCTIPSLPGENAPLEQENEKIPAKNAPRLFTQLVFLQKDTQELRKWEGKISPLSVRTIYCR